MPKEIPILFSTAMIEALLAGRKTMTRRLSGLGNININPSDWSLIGIDVQPRSVISHAGFRSLTVDDTTAVKSKYGNIGDILWVRESFADGYKNILDIPDMQYWVFKNGDQIYSNGDYAKAPFAPTAQSSKNIKWKPSIHMPKSAARIWLEVVNVRVERLQDITPQDAIAEGIELAPDSEGRKMYKSYSPFFQNEYVHLYNDIEGRESVADPVLSLFGLWASINGRNGVKGFHSFVDNPWVWVIEFKVLSTTGKPKELQTVQECDATAAK